MKRCGKCHGTGKVPGQCINVRNEPGKRRLRCIGDAGHAGHHYKIFQRRPRRTIDWGWGGWVLGNAGPAYEAEYWS